MSQEGDKFNYMLLGRLQQDCEYYLGNGNRAKKHLWAGDESEQIRKMRELYATVAQKPEWISLEDIQRYEAAMVGVQAHADSGDETVTVGNEHRQRG